MGFNRTFMELKLKNTAVCVRPDGFNRTFMELKSVHLLQVLKG